MIALYIHIPFCLHKCSYCDFYSLPITEDAIPQRQYVDRLLEELRMMVAQYQLSGRALTSIFFGGGTPSMLEPRLLGEFLDILPTYFSVPAGIEITCEANPETLTLERLQALRAAGINRLSMGVQSFQPHHLTFLERVHSAERAIAAAHDIHRAGFTNFNIDLIYGLPSQTLAECLTDVEQAIALAPTHISAYQLTVEAQTPLAVRVRDGRVTMPDDDLVLAMWEAVCARLAAAGYAVYEISNHARTGYECRHNLNYWEYGEYLGLGTGACSFLRCDGHVIASPSAPLRAGSPEQSPTCTPEIATPRCGEARNDSAAFALRFQRARNLRRYLAGELACDYEDPITRAMAMGECAFLALRTERGLNEARFRAVFDCSPVDIFGTQFHQWTIAGWLQEVPGTYWSLTPAGRRIANTLAAQLV